MSFKHFQNKALKQITYKDQSQIDLNSSNVLNITNNVNITLKRKSQVADLTFQ